MPRTEPAISDPMEAFACLNLLDYLSDLFTAAEKESFTRLEILNVLNLCKNDPELFDPRAVIAQEEATAHVPCAACGGSGCPACDPLD